MNGSDIDRRLDRIGRRQAYVLVLLVYPYLVGIAWAATGRIEVSTTDALAALLPAVLLLAAAYLVALVRARMDGTPTG